MFVSKSMTQEEFLKRIDDLDIKIKPLDKYTRLFDNIRWQCDKYENHIWYATPANVLRVNGTRCPYCSGNKVLKGFNDLFTTHPKIASMLLDENIGYEVSYSSHKRTDWVCPSCNSIVKNKIIKDVVTFGLSCSCCSDGISYPEKLVSNILNQLKITYKHDCSFEWSNNKRYDFYIESLSMIIECHGEQHYNDKKQWSGDLDSQVDNDNQKMLSAISNGIKHYIQIDCRESTLDYIRNSILNSEIADIFDLSSLDWNECDARSQKSNVVKCADLWNQGIKSTLEISKIMKLNRVTVINYLNRMTEIGMCDYDGKAQMRLSADRNRRRKDAA